MGDTQRGDTGGWGQGAEPSRAGILEHLVSFFPAWLRPRMLTEDWQLPRHPFPHSHFVLTAQGRRWGDRRANRQLYFDSEYSRRGLGLWTIMHVQSPKAVAQLFMERERGWFFVCLFVFVLGLFCCSLWKTNSASISPVPVGEVIYGLLLFWPKRSWFFFFLLLPSLLILFSLTTMALPPIPFLASFPQSHSWAVSPIEWRSQDGVIRLKPPYVSFLYPWVCWRQEHRCSYYGFKWFSGCTSHLAFLFQYIHTYIHTYICILYILSCLTCTRTVGTHWWSRVVSFGCRPSATAGLLREMDGGQGVRAQAGKKSLLLKATYRPRPSTLAL